MYVRVLPSKCDAYDVCCPSLLAMGITDIYQHIYQVYFHPFPP